MLSPTGPDRVDMCGLSLSSVLRQLCKSSRFIQIPISTCHSCESAHNPSDIPVTSAAFFNSRCSAALCFRLLDFLEIFAMATASVTVPGSGVIPCPLPATVEDAICAVQKMQPGGWENAVLSQGVQHLEPGTALEAIAYSGSPNFEQLLEPQTFNLYHASHWIITPATLRYTCSFVELVAKDAETQFPCWFVSHAWQEAVCRFVACLRQHAELRNAVQSAYWV
eukprot:s982_g20.t1